MKTKINLIIWSFFWNEKFEPVARQTCYCTSAYGGLGIVDFIKKSNTLKISSVVKIIQDPNAKSFFLLKYFLEGRLAGLRGEWLHLRDNTYPSALSATAFYDKDFIYRKFVLFFLFLTGKILSFQLKKFIAFC